MNNWNYSPNPAVEKTIARIRDKFPADYPAGLERVENFLAKLGHPHHRLPFTFHVAGTNGKGSTLAFLQAILETSGKSVHKFISPHLVQFEERIVLNGRMIDDTLLLSLIHECEEAAEGLPVSFFEFFTVLAFLAYSRSPADALLLETGLGGTYDATNVVGGKNLVSLLTRISYDHTHILGKTLTEIAGNKAGIIKPGCPVVSSPQTEEAMKVFHDTAVKMKTTLPDWSITPDSDHFVYKSDANTFRLPLPNLIGQHQLYNAGTAIAAIEQSPFAALLQQKTLEQAMKNVIWPGRLQRLTTGHLAELLPPGWELWLDGAHNDSGAEILAEQIKTWGQSMPLHLITAMKRTKHAGDFYRPLLPHIATVQAVDVSWIEAPMTPASVLCDQIRSLGHTHVSEAPDLESALRSLAFSFKPPQRILITGSLYLVGHALKEKYGEAANSACG